MKTDNDNFKSMLPTIEDIIAMKDNTSLDFYIADRIWGDCLHNNNNSVSRETIRNCFYGHKTLLHDSRFNSMLELQVCRMSVADIADIMKRIILYDLDYTTIIVASEIHNIRSMKSHFHVVWSNQCQILLELSDLNTQIKFIEGIFRMVKTQLNSGDFNPFIVDWESGTYKGSI